MKFSDRTIAALTIPEAGQKFYADDTPCLYIRTSCGGSKSFLFIHGKERRKITLGRYPTMSLAQARNEAKRLLAEKTLGTLSTKSRPYSLILDTYLEQYRAKNRERTAFEHERLLRRHFKFGSRSVDQITKADVVAVIDDLSDTPALASHAAPTAAKTFFTYCARRGYIQISPCHLLQASASHEEAGRVLSDQELKTFLTEAYQGSHAYHKILLLLAYTGQRPKDIAALRREWMQGDLIAYPAKVMKNRMEHFVPITASMRDILATLPAEGLLFPSSAGTPFSAWSKNHRKFIAACGFHFERYDLRRTFSTRAAEWKCGPAHAVELLMNHKHPASLGSKIARVYNPHTYLDELRTTLENYESHLKALIA